MLENIKALVMDFDGVFTDNRVLVFDDGREAVFVSRSDGMGISILRKLDFPMIVISTERNAVVTIRCEKLALECVQGVDDKLPVLREWAQNKSIDLQDVAYVGNDVNDAECMDAVGVAIAVADAHPSALGIANLVLSASGGQGAIREVVDMIIK